MRSHLAYTSALDGLLHLGIIIARGAKGEMMQAFLGARIEQDGLAWQLRRTEVDGLIPGGLVGQAKIAVKSLSHA